MRSDLTCFDFLDVSRRSPMVLTVLGLLALTGCAVSRVIPNGAMPEAVALHGKAHGGQQPVGFAAIQLWAAGSGGNGSAATPLLSNAVFTDARGSFSISGQYTCPSASAEVYVSATGGNPGLPGNGTNPALALVTVLGECGSLSAATNVEINEVTTVAAAYALAPFASGVGSVASSATNTAGLRTAMGNAMLLADSGSGVSPAAALPAQVTVESAKIYTLANLLASCVNSDGTSLCQGLFADATPAGGAAPTDTFSAALKIAGNPAHNVGTLFNDIPPQVAFGGGLAAAPNDWSMSMSYVDGQLNGPTALAIDSAGEVVVAMASGPVAAYTPQGVNLWSSANVITGSQVQPAIAITADQEVWVTGGMPGAGFAEISSFGLPLSGGDPMNGMSAAPTSVAASPAGGLWTANEAGDTVSLLTPSGTAANGAAGVNPGNMLNAPAAVAVDNSGNAWIANGGTVTEISAAGAAITGNPYTLAGGRLDSIALDAAGHVWAGDRRDMGLFEYDATGYPVAGYAANGEVFTPRAIAVDGVNRIWTTNPGANALWQTQDGVASHVTVGADAAMHEPWGLAVDASGTIWVASSGDNRLVAFVGLGAPVKMPMLGLPQQP